MHVEIETEAAQFPEKEYINGIFLAVRENVLFFHNCELFLRKHKELGDFRKIFINIEEIWQHFAFSKNGSRHCRFNPNPAHICCVRVSCWPPTPEMTTAVIPCFKELNGIIYDHTCE
jgi:hypothetical protein